MGWVDDNLALLREAFPGLEDAEVAGVHWVRLRDYAMPAGWTPAIVELAFRIPTQAAEAPYGFWVRPGPTAPGNAAPINYSYPTTTAWGDNWGQFSFAPDGPWVPAREVAKGPNMVRFARAIADRLKEGV